MPLHRARNISPPGAVGGGGGGGDLPGTALWRAFGRADGLATKADLGVDATRLRTNTRNDITLDPEVTLRPRTRNDLTLDVQSPMRMTARTRNDVSLRFSQARLFPGAMLPTEDTWLDQANPDTAHGGDATLIAKQTVPLNNNASVLYIAWDLTGVNSGLLNTATIDLTLQNTGLTTVNAPYEFYTSPSKPFEEDTATWNNSETPSGTVRQSGNISAPTTYTEQSLGLGATARANMLGNWCWLRITGADGLGVNSINVRSKEHATASERPELTIELAIV